MLTIRSLLKTKGSVVWHISPKISILEALRTMEARNIGALIVQEQGKLIGIVSERDFARTVARSGACAVDTAIENYMTKKVITIDIDQTIDASMRLMTENHIRHLPVLEKGQVAGVITLGDVVTEILTNKDSLITSLENYIQGSEFNG